MRTRHTVSVAELGDGFARVVFHCPTHVDETCHPHMHGQPVAVFRAESRRNRRDVMDQVGCTSCGIPPRAR